MYRARYPSAPGMHNDYSYGGGDSYTRVEYRRNPGYFERVGNSCCGIFIGIVVLVLAFPVLFFNEGRAVQTAKSLDEGLHAVVSLTSTDTIFESNNNHLVHLSGKLRTDLPLTDDEYGIRIYAVKLRRTVEMYQWVEQEHKREYNEGERTRIETTYSYNNEWKSEVVNSGSFNNPTAHRNPNSFPVKSMTKTADPVFVGQFQLSRELASKVSEYHSLQPKTTPVGKNDFVMMDNYLYKSHDPYKPKVGDIRISFSYAGSSGSEESAREDQVSIIARQNGIYLTTYRTIAGDVLELLYSGVKSAKEIFDAEHSANTVLTWILRFVGWLMMFIGFQIMMDIFRQLVSFIPVVREIIGLTTSLVAFTFATSLALITIAIGWLRYRPFVAAAILIGAAVPIYMSRMKAANEKEEGKRKGEN